MDDKTTAFVMQNETVWFKPEAKGFFVSVFDRGKGIRRYDSKFKI